MEQYNKIGYGPHGIIQIKNFVEEVDLEDLSTFLHTVEDGIIRREQCPKEIADTLSRYEEKTYAEVVANISDKYDIPVVPEPTNRAQLVKWGMLKGFAMRPHSDAETPDRQPAIAGGFYRFNVTAIAYLTDNYLGGEIRFPEFDITLKPRAGDLLLFPSRYRHEIKQYISGERYTMPMFFTFDVEDPFTDEEREQVGSGNMSDILFDWPS